jgi:hypothetical protein
MEKDVKFFQVNKIIDYSFLIGMADNLKLNLD